MPLPEAAEIQLREAERRHERGNHEGAIDILGNIKDEDLLLGTSVEQADVSCLWGYCLENLEDYLQAKKRHLIALCLIGNTATEEIEREITREKQVKDRLRQENKGMNEEERRLEGEWRVKEKDIATNSFDTLMPVAGNAQMATNAVKAVKVFSALGDLFEKEKDVDARIQYERAKKLCACVINGGGADDIKAEAHYRMAYVLMKLEDYKGSKDNYEKAINLYENKKLQVKDRPKRLAKAYNSLGNLYRCEGYLEDAKLAYEKAVAVEADKDFTPAMNNLAYTLYELGEYKKAKEKCDNAEKLWEESAEFYDTRGCVYARLKMFKESKDYFEKALAKKKREPSIYNNYGEMLRVAGAYEEAKTQLEKALGLDESFALAHSNLGDLYREQGDLYGKEEDRQKKYVEAEEEYERAKKLKPRLPDARFGLANLYVSQIEAEEEKDKKSKLSYKKALGEMKIICRSSGNWVKRRPSFYLLRGYIYGKLDEPYKAKMNFKKCRKLAKDDEEIASKAEDNLDALRAIELDKRMMWGGIALSILACIVLIVLTLFYLYPYPFSKGGSKGGTSSGSTKKVIVTKVEPGETTETTETKAGDTTTTVTKETKKGKEITETTETKEPGKTGKTDDEESLVGDTTYQIVAPFCLAFIALGVSLPFVTRVKFKDLEFDKTSIAGMSSELNLVR